MGQRLSHLSQSAPFDRRLACHRPMCRRSGPYPLRGCQTTPHSLRRRRTAVHACHMLQNW